VDLQSLRRDSLLFNPKDFGTIFAFVDFSNVRYWAKSFWAEDNRERLVREVDIEKVAQLIDMVGTVEKYFYYGHYKQRPNLPPEHPSNVPYRNSIFRIDKARKAGFRVRTKDIKTIDTYDEAGKRQGQIHKCNFDVEIAMDMIKQLPKYDTVFLWSGDSDFGPLLAYLRRRGKKVVTVCSRAFASSEIQRASDTFIPGDRLRDQLELVPHKKALPA
jgi:uncharacterized LabA/DUF88 family protein